MASEEIKIIVIDDEKLITNMFEAFFEDYDVDVKSADTGAGGLELVANERFDAAIVDIRLPDMDGGEFILKSSRIQPRIKYFIHTGSHDYRPSEELLAVGVTEDSIMHKPLIDMEEIYRAILEKVRQK